MNKCINRITNIDLGVLTNNFYEFWWICVFSRVTSENHQGGSNRQIKSCLSTAKWTSEGSTRLERTPHQSGGQATDRWGRPAPPRGHLAPRGPTCQPPSYVGFPPPPRMHLRHPLSQFDLRAHVGRSGLYIPALPPPWSHCISHLRRQKPQSSSELHQF